MRSHFFRTLNNRKVNNTTISIFLEINVVFVFGRFLEFDLEILLRVLLVQYFSQFLSRQK
jgi:hypothetical protein